MRIDRESPNNIYLTVSREIDGILKKLDSCSDDGQLLEAKESAMKNLSEFQGKINKHITELEDSAEWETFTIAFYGETNAGKSTIIETLRIMLGEKSKAKAQQEFKHLQDKHGLTEENFLSLKQAIEQCEELLVRLEQELNDNVRQYDAQEAALKNEIRRLLNLIDEKKRIASFFQKLLIILFRKLPEQKENKTLTLSLKALPTERAKFIKHNKRQQLKAQKQKTVSEQVHERLSTKLKKLEAFADGGNIGDGLPDYTVKTQHYDFEISGQNFVLLDVPGIEGKESKVTDEIWLAVRKAHAVFYVTRKASAPQKGNDGEKGTLEKIKEHLGSQTEVWTIFNKGITSPSALGVDLITQDERESLNILDDRMKEQLGENYQKVIELSAQPAFLAVANCLIQDSKHAISRAKFLNKFSQQELILRSNFSEFHALLTNELMKDNSSKIIQSNFNKANQVVKTAKAEITIIQREIFRPLEKQQGQIAEDACSKLDFAMRALKTRMESQGVKEVNNFEYTVKAKIYELIDNNISNDDFRSKLENCIQDGLTKLDQQMPKVIENELKRFQSELADVIEVFNEHSNELMEIYSNNQAQNLDFKFDLKINIDNGINVQNLLVTLVGGGLLIFTTGGWYLALGLFTLVISLGKSLWSLINSDYKKAQQRNSAGENLRAVSKNMQVSMHENLNTAFPKLETKVENIKNALEEPAHQLAEINRTLTQSIAELTKLSNSIEAIGVK
jgi:hypothetical protein